ncbi:Mor transcription activator family protein [Mariprofundus ferrooxydans]|uniref:Mor transcription activator family protein n=1 Tax=Mariprofundus ferrooxydans TaxID=314344 RepID=UPI001431A5CD|nr:Mor transcription activator family protein [Mariprofundus ferrooxydans]
MRVDEISTLFAEADPDNAIALVGHLIGPENLRLVLDTIGGGEIYMPTYDNLIRSLTRDQRDERIRNRYNGSNTTQLAIEYDLKPRRIQQIVAGRKIPEETT